MAAPKTKKRYGTSRKRGQADLARADEVQDSLEEFWELIRRYRYPVGLGLGALCVFVFGLDAWQQSSVESQRTESQAFSEATDLLDAAIVAPGDEAPAEGVSFATTEERATEALAQIDGFASANAGGQLEDAASLAATQALMDLGRWDDALARVQPWIDENRDADLTPLLRQRAATIALSKGDAAGAKAQYEALVAMSNWWHQASGHLGLGDLQHPAFATEGGDAAAARQHYDAALESLASVERSSLAQSVRSVVQTRLAALP